MMPGISNCNSPIWVDFQNGTHRNKIIAGTNNNVEAIILAGNEGSMSLHKII
jgi:hypothetical protein